MTEGMTEGMTGGGVTVGVEAGEHGNRGDMTGEHANLMCGLHAGQP
jgi:hypothetical protein